MEPIRKKESGNLPLTGNLVGVFAIALGMLPVVVFSGVMLSNSREPVLQLAGFLPLVINIAILLYVLVRINTRHDALRHAKTKVERSLLSIPQGMISVDALGRIEFLNATAQDMTGWTLENARGKPLSQIYSVLREDTRQLFTHPAETPTDPRAFGVDRHHILATQAGRQLVVEDSVSPVVDDDGKLAGAVLLFRDVTGERESALKLSWEANHDPLTGLANRRRFEMKLEGLLASATRGDEHHILLFIDLDKFKVVNDTCGHLAGDELLRQISTVLASCIRDRDVLGRLGGDEFGVLLGGCKVEQGLRIANNLRNAVHDFRFSWEEKVFPIGASIGMVQLDHGSGTVAQVLAEADSACYMAKEHGRNNVHLYQGGAEAASAAPEGGMVTNIIEAFELGQFRLYRQKALELKPRSSPGSYQEILLRMVDREGKLIPPMAFIPTAERYNLMQSIDRWVLRTAFSTLNKEFETPAPGAPNTINIIGINISAASLNDSSFPVYLRDQLELHRFPPQSLCIEITESVAVRNLTKTVALLRTLKELGCLVALDDFGAGMSSFAYLRYLPVDFIKIDGAHIKGMVDDRMSFEIVTAINNIAHVLGVQTIAEFCEDESALEGLRRIGLDYAQGHAAGKPWPLV